MDLTYAISIVNWIYRNILLESFFFFFHNNTVKISEILNKWNLLKIYLQTTYTVRFFA